MNNKAKDIVAWLVISPLILGLTVLAIFMMPAVAVDWAFKQLGRK